MTSIYPRYENKVAKSSQNVQPLKCLNFGNDGSKAIEYFL